MKILLIFFFTFYLISGAVRCFSVTGYSGGSLLVDSRKTWHNNKAKYMNKLQSTTIINYRKHDQWINGGRFTLICNDYGNLMIYFRDVITQDAGTYRVGVEGKWYIDMTLKVKEDSCCNVSKKVMFKSGEAAHFSCEYSQKHIKDPKIIFKEGKESIKTIYSTLNKKGRFSISDNRHKNFFSVRISAVRPDDGGVYLCGVSVLRHSYSYFIINIVHLHIMDKKSSMIIIICVCVILLLIGGFTLTVCKLRHKRRGQTSTSEKRKRKKNAMSSCADSRRDFLTDPGSAQINSPDELLTIPSDELIYASVNFQKHEESLSDATVSFSKDQIHCDYATVSHRMRLN